MLIKIYLGCHFQLIYSHEKQSESRHCYIGNNSLPDLVETLMHLKQILMHQIY